jgi:hypothetical protein
LLKEKACILEIIKTPYFSKDLSILIYSVPDFIEGNQELMKNILELEDADIKDGGCGAFYIYLKIST